MTELPPLEKKTGKEIIYEVEDEIDYDEYGHAVNSEDLDALHEKVWVSLESIQARDTKIADGLICSSVFKLGNSISCSEVQGFGGNCRCNNCLVYLRLRGLEK